MSRMSWNTSTLVAVVFMKRHLTACLACFCVPLSMNVLQMGTWVGRENRIQIHMFPVTVTPLTVTSRLQ